MLTGLCLGTITCVDIPFLLWMLVILKIPIVAAFLLIWYAVQEPEPAGQDDEGGSRVPREPSPQPDRPHSPRRGPHATPPAPSPDRIRVVKNRRGRRPAGR
jgi:hypothetical protein